MEKVNPGRKIETIICRDKDWQSLTFGQANYNKSCPRENAIVVMQKKIS